MKFAKGELIMEINNPVCESLFLKQGWSPVIEEPIENETDEVTEETVENSQTENDAVNEGVASNETNNDAENNVIDEENNFEIDDEVAIEENNIGTDDEETEDNKVIDEISNDEPKIYKKGDFTTWSKEAILELAESLGYSLTATKKAEMIEEFLKFQDK